MQRAGNWIIVADAHQNPPGLSPMFISALDMAYVKGFKFASNGDTFQVLPHGIKKWIGSPAVTELKKYCLYRCFEVVLIEGNHDLYKSLVKLFGGCEYIKVVKSLEIPYRDTKIVIQHGHNFGPLWSWLKYIAPPFVNCMADNFPGTWYKFSKARGWIPSQTVGEKRYHIVVRAVISRGLKFISENQCRVALGHTHKKTCVKEQFPYGTDYVLLCLAPLDTGCFVSVGDAFRYGSLT